MFVHSRSLGLAPRPRTPSPHRADRKNVKRCRSRSNSSVERISHRNSRFLGIEHHSRSRSPNERKHTNSQHHRSRSPINRSHQRSQSPINRTRDRSRSPNNSHTRDLDHQSTERDRPPISQQTTSGKEPLTVTIFDQPTVIQLPPTTSISRHRQTGTVESSSSVDSWSTSRSGNMNHPNKQLQKIHTHSHELHSIIDLRRTEIIYSTLLINVYQPMN